MVFLGLPICAFLLILEKKEAGELRAWAYLLALVSQ